MTNIIIIDRKGGNAIEANNKFGSGSSMYNDTDLV
jgi:hypothetical protein